MASSTVNAMTKPHWLAIIFFSLASVIPAAAVLFAGSASYGPISEVWKHVPVPILLAVGYASIFLGIGGLRLGSSRLGLKEYVVPVVFVAVAAVPLTFVTLLVVLKSGGFGG